MLLFTRLYLESHEIGQISSVVITKCFYKPGCIKLWLRLRNKLVPKIYEALVEVSLKGMLQ